MDRVAILGTGWQLGFPEISPIDRAVQMSISSALASAQMELADIDMVLTVGSDIMDGAMVATRSGIAGSYSRQIMTVPSSAGHAFAAALSMIESGNVRNVLLVGWGEGTKFQALDSREIQADPFYARPVGADPVTMSVMQAQRLVSEGLIDPDEAGRYGDAMREHAKVTQSFIGAARWLGTRWCDGACALVMAPAHGPGRQVTIRDIGTSFEPYCPDPHRLNPADWVRSAVGAMSEGASLRGDALKVIEIGGPTPFSELAALSGICAKSWQSAQPKFNLSGGGAAAHFGPATGLRRIICAAETLSDADPGALAGIVDLAGPIGQAVSVIALEASS